MKTDTYRCFECSSIFAPYIKEYVELKRSYGFKYNTEAHILCMFDSFVQKNGIVAPSISKGLMDSWSQKRDNENETTHALRIRVIQGFFIYLNHKGIDSPTIFPPRPKVSHNFIPYIFSAEEIQRLFSAIDKEFSEPVAISPIRHLVFPVLFRMMYGCGLRESEALHIKKQDVNFKDSSVRIINSKGNKDRMVIMSKSLTEICYNYTCNPEIQSFESEYFFPAPDHLYYAGSSIYEAFRRGLFAAGIGYRGREKGPRLHDLRHTFAVHVLSQWQREGKDLYVCLPILCDYLGHKNLFSTEKYLQLVPEAYGEVTDAFNSKYNNVFPEVEYEAE